MAQGSGTLPIFLIITSFNLNLIPQFLKFLVSCKQRIIHVHGRDSGKTIATGDRLDNVVENLPACAVGTADRLDLSGHVLGSDFI